MYIRYQWHTNTVLDFTTLWTSVWPPMWAGTSMNLNSQHNPYLLLMNLLEEHIFSQSFVCNYKAREIKSEAQTWQVKEQMWSSKTQNVRTAKMFTAFFISCKKYKEGCENSKWCMFVSTLISYWQAHNVLKVERSCPSLLKCVSPHL